MHPFVWEGERELESHVYKQKLAPTTISCSVCKYTFAYVLTRSPTQSGT